MAAPPKRSALTAALSGAPQQSPSKQAPSTPPLAGLGALEACFPCLYACEDDGSSLASETLESSALLADSLQKMDLGKVTVVGSLPTSTTLNGRQLADYPLDPYRRRGGKECLSSSVTVSASAGIDDKLGRLLSGSLSQNYDAVIGSLPRGMSNEQRLRIRESAPMSPALGSLSELPSDKVGARSVEGRKLRRSVLKGSTIAFVTAGYSGKRFIFEKCHELGVKAVVLDGPDSWAQLLETQGIISKFVPIDFSDAEHAFDNCLKAIKAVGTVDGITTFCEMAVPLVARLTEAMGLPGNIPEAVDAARDKYATRAGLAAAGLPTPRNSRISKPEDVQPAGEYVRFPSVIKPVSGAASIGVIRVNDMQQLQAAYRRVVKDLSRAKVVAGALVEGDGEDEAAVDGNAGSWFKVELMLEEYLDGPEVDCDLVFSEGVCVYGAVTDNWPTVEPYFNETGSNCPSILPRQQQKELMELSVASVKALGFTSGVFHVESKYTSRGARLIEVNARMGGGPVRDTNLLVWGVDLVEEHLMCSVGIPARPPVARRPLVQMAEYSINAKVSGVLRDTRFLDKWRNHPDVLYARPLVEAGSKVVCVEDGLPTWVCELMVVKPSVQEAIAFIQQIEADMVIPIDPAPAKKA